MILSEYDFLRLKGILERLRESPQADNRQLSVLEAKLAAATVVPPEFLREDAVSLNSKVRFTDLKACRQWVYTVVFPAESDIEREKVSVLSPIGLALLGAKAGEVVDCQASLGLLRLRVEEVLFQPEAAGYFFV
jgi:regulator of nucleoside diphosphate kinase